MRSGQVALGLGVRTFGAGLMENALFNDGCLPPGAPPSVPGRKSLVGFG